MKAWIQFREFLKRNNPFFSGRKPEAARRVYKAASHPAEAAGEGRPTPQAGLSSKLKNYLSACYEFRYNLLTDENEFRRKAEGTAFAALTQREMNTLCMEVQEQGIECWDRDLARYVNSACIPAYHPFSEYLEGLPAWDGVDRLMPLAARVSGNGVWKRGFRLWMLGMVNQWKGDSPAHANSIAPILVSAEQGKRKSTFCKLLLPPVLQRYYTDSVELTSQVQVERKLSEMGLINLDEFDKFSSRKMALLKNLMQMSFIHLRRPYQKDFQTLPRIGSFIGTTNRKDLLTDPTGSRRFICVEVEEKIDCTNIAYEQLYAQLKALLAAGERHWFTAAEERELQQHNLAFYRHSPVEDVFRSCFRAAREGEQALLLSAAEIFKVLKTKNSAAMRGANPGAFGQVLVAAGIERKHTNVGNVYRVVRV